jgi:hypothetical protein
MTSSIYKNKISNNLFLLYPFIYNFNYNDVNVNYNNNTSVIINNKEYKDFNSISDLIINLVSVDIKNKKIFNISDENIKNNNFYRYQLFIYKFINILRNDYNLYIDHFKTLYNIYKTYIIDIENINSFIDIYKTKKSLSDINIIINEIYGFKKAVSAFEELKNIIINANISNQKIIYESLYDNDNDKIKLYMFKDFIDYLNILYNTLSIKLEEFIKTFNDQIIIYNKKEKYNSKIPDIFKDKISKEYINIKELREDRNNKPIYENILLYINDYIDYSKDIENKERYNKIINLSSKDKTFLKRYLVKYYYLLDTNSGKWKDDIINIDDDFKEKLRTLQLDYSNIIQLFDYKNIQINKDYFEITNIYEKLLTISNNIKLKKRLTEDDFNLIKNFKIVQKELADNPLYKDDNEYKKALNKLIQLYDELSKGPDAILTADKINEVDVIRSDTIYFDTNIDIFKLILKYMITFLILLILMIVLLSFLSVLILIYDIIYYIFNLFINPNLTKALSIDYLTKNMIYCDKNNYKDDRYLLFTVQSQNLSVFTISAYILYLLIGLLIFYLIHVLYASYAKKILKGSIYDIDKEGGIIIIFIIILIYSVIHLFLYKILFKPFIYTQYKNYNKQEEDVDKLLDNLILIRSVNSTSDELLIDNNFFDILFDLTRIDELNTLFLNGIKDNNYNGCLEQKIIIYDLYIYLKEHISFDEKKQKQFKDYCTSDFDNKPINNDTNKKITFISLLNNNEVRMIKKYHEELDFFNNIPNKNIEYYNQLNKNINFKLKKINENIITYNKTLIPFFLTILYIIGVFFFTFLLFYVLINLIILGDSKMSDDNKFNYYFVYILYIIKTYIYDKIIKWFYKLD